MSILQSLRFPLMGVRPTRLPYGGLWLARNDYCSSLILRRDFENPERLFVEEFLRKGMVVLDIGAHHGFYTILASKKVGSSGRVIAFEPSPRERRRLILHLWLNRCKNVMVEPFAISGKEGESDFFIVKDWNTGCNALRPPQVSESIYRVSVQTTTVDTYLRQNSIGRVDFVKVDAEGGELEIFRDATTLLTDFRPVILCELDDVRTRPWGYSPDSVTSLLETHRYQWFGLDHKGHLVPSGERQSYNQVAFPAEKLPWA